jgi:hypothetical protein
LDFYDIHRIWQKDQIESIRSDLLAYIRSKELAYITSDQMRLESEQEELGSEVEIVEKSNV